MTFAICLGNKLPLIIVNHLYNFRATDYIKSQEGIFCFNSLVLCLPTLVSGALLINWPPRFIGGHYLFSLDKKTLLPATYANRVLSFRRASKEGSA